MASYLPPQAEATRAVVFNIDPYDPQVITDMLDLGIDPLAVIAERRQELQEAKRVMQTPTYSLARVLYQGGAWGVEDQPTDEGYYIETSGRPFPVNEVAQLGYVVTPQYSGARVLSPTGENIYIGLKNADRILYPAIEPEDGGFHNSRLR